MNLWTSRRPPTACARSVSDPSALAGAAPDVTTRRRAYPRCRREASATPPPPSAGSQFLTVFPPIMLPMFLAVADQTIVATALPAIASSLGEIERASWVVVSYLIANTIAAPVYGRLGDTFGRRLMMFVALAIFMAGSVLCALAPSIELLTAFRVLQGFGGGGLMTLSQALIGEAIPPRERGRYQGYLAGIAVSSNTFGPVAGGYLTQAFGWQSIFLDQHSARPACRCCSCFASRRARATAAAPRSIRPAWCCSSSSSARSSWRSSRCSAWS